MTKSISVACVGEELLYKTCNLKSASTLKLYLHILTARNYLLTYSYFSLSHRVPLTEESLTLGLNNFPSRVECDEAVGGNFSAEGRYMGGAKTF